MTLEDAVFMLDGSPVWCGEHDPDVTWNGSPVPAFDRAEAARIGAWCATIGDAAEWSGDVLTVTSEDGGTVDVISPDSDGRYVFHGWVWTETSQGDCGRCSAYVTWRGTWEAETGEACYDGGAHSVDVWHAWRHSDRKYPFVPRIV